MKLILILLLCCASVAHGQRTFWARSVDSLATGRVPHTHVATSGRVTLVAKQSDGDVHIRLTTAKGAFIVCECIPELLCPILPRVGDSVLVKGIYRHDPEHGWWEIHPVESLAVIR